MNLEFLLHALEDVNALVQPSLLVVRHGLALHADETVMFGGDLIDLGLHLLDVRGFLVGATFARRDVTRAEEILLNELVHGVVVTAAVERLSGFVAVFVIFDGGISADLVLSTQLLFDRAINIENSNGRSVSVSGSELVVCRLHRFAVTSPRSEEFYDRILARIENLVVEIGVGELFGERNGSKRCGEAEHF